MASGSYGPWGVAPPRWIRPLHLGFKPLVWIWGAIFLGGFVNIGSSWLTTKNFDLGGTPLGWGVDHPWITLLPLLLLVLLTGLSGLARLSRPVRAESTESISAASPQAQPLPVNPPSSLWNIPYSRNAFFTGREQLLQQLAEILKAEQATALSQAQAISGLGGIGKTQIAVEFAYRHRHDYEAVLWVSADTHESLISGYITIAKRLGLPEKDAKELQTLIQAVKMWLETHGSWLLILDNAEDLKLAYEFLPPTFSGHLLLTTQNQNMGRFAKRVEVETMDQNMGTLFLLRRAGLVAENASLDTAWPSDVVTAREICEELGRLPLALDQAGAYIDEVQCCLLDYRQHYQTHPTHLLKRRGEGGADHPKPVATTWSLSFEKVEQRSPVAADLLRLCALLHPDAIPVELITEGACHLGPSLAPLAEDNVALDEAIAVLRTYSLISRDRETKTLSLHRLVQVAVGDTMDKQTRHLWVERMVRAVNAVFPVVSFTTWPQCERCLSHARVCAELVEQEQITGPEAARLLRNAGNYLIERAHFTQGRHLLQQSLSMRVGLDVRRVDQVELLYEQVLRIDEEVYGSEDLEVVADINNLANLYKTQGKYDKAKPLFQRALTIRRQALGETHPDTAQSMWCLAFTYAHLQQYGKAEPLYKKAFSTFKQKYGLENLNVKKLREDYASLLREMGRDKDADSLETLGHLLS